ncbi:hypothetical protein BpHYR1_015923 [Brachionus plicatilis]|uniref:Uncharacterized protein n=1 Tax=Brachionus plicatilis TaxID=10195 RepID=A0A3M7PBK5_BRAPC|nr:hypothetical protein BpHYR1_015923 [Brachionus plicatilis]
MFLKFFLISSEFFSATSLPIKPPIDLRKFDNQLRYEENVYFISFLPYDQKRYSLRHFSCLFAATHLNILILDLLTFVMLFFCTLRVWCSCSLQGSRTY